MKYVSKADAHPAASTPVAYLNISGYDKYKEPNAIVVELKQWDEVDIVEGQDAMVETFTGGSKRRVVHPSYQAWSYKSMICDYNSKVQERRIKISPCAYLHNYRKQKPEKLESIQYKEYVEEAPLFGRGEVDKLREFIKKSVVYGDKKEILYEIDNGKIKPSKSLQDSIKSMLDGNREFIMLDDQKVVYEQILATSLQCMKDHKKRTVIVKGGPGTGKTVVAINLLAELLQYIYG